MYLYTRKFNGSGFFHSFSLSLALPDSRSDNSTDDNKMNVSSSYLPSDLVKYARSFFGTFDDSFISLHTDSNHLNWYFWVGCCFNYINALGKLKSHILNCVQRHKEREREGQKWNRRSLLPTALKWHFVCIFSRLNILFSLSHFLSSVNIIYKEVCVLLLYFPSATCWQI